jgi:hypothetical protein
MIISEVCRLEKSSYLNRTGSVIYIGRHCEEFFHRMITLTSCFAASSEMYMYQMTDFKIMIQVVIHMFAIHYNAY